ncbi:flagellar hook assembly protein FlgD [Photobacterium sp. TY1-4]|uniref:flagellar hook assembly protein FlgD n=1 Tax=Photobacterium sp. TY1-4 TaxID=2899122 RepID=UPI0021C1718B|nr:flagellar hook assembly protein FlgD [Photobacterium sp. TY1-4]UXI03102.1 flagellar hook assembly protein FlgD [Photobacterium sp. TY1-4]
MSLAPFNAMSTDKPVSTVSENQVKANPTEMNSAESLHNEFITLMVAQIQNQDPLNPLDGTEYVGQLAQFSQVESTENMSKVMQNSMVLLDNMQVLSTAGLVGQTVYVDTEAFELSEQVQKGKLELQHASNQVNLLIKDEYGQTTKVPMGGRAPGDVDFTIDPATLGLKPGKYTVAVELDEGLTQPNILMSGEVAQVRVPSNGGAALVNVAGVGSVPFYQISQFGA